MTRPQIIAALNSNHQQFITFLSQLDNDAFVAERNGKWTAGQHLEHIIRSIKPLNQGLMLPGFLLQLIFGKTNRPSKSYDGLVAKYQQKLSEGGKATAAFTPPVIAAHQKERLLQELNSRCGKLCRQANKFSEAQLDALIAPHPLLGKVTLREMLYFMAYHVLHHLQLVQENLQ